MLSAPNTDPGPIPFSARFPKSGSSTEEPSRGSMSHCVRSPPGLTSTFAVYPSQTPTDSNSSSILTSEKLGELHQPSTRTEQSGQIFGQHPLTLRRLRLLLSPPGLQFSWAEHPRLGWHRGDAGGIVFSKRRTGAPTPPEIHSTNLPIPIPTHPTCPLPLPPSQPPTCDPTAARWHRGDTATCRHLLLAHPNPPLPPRRCRPGLFEAAGMGALGAKLLVGCSEAGKTFLFLPYMSWRGRPGRGGQRCQGRRGDPLAGGPSREACAAARPCVAFTP